MVFGYCINHQKNKVSFIMLFYNNAFKKLITKISQNGGYIALDEFVQFCLCDKEYGYYILQHVIGKDKDFITAPEISQLFGEMIGVWMLNQWQILNEPCNISILELGPGRGLLMRDILRTFKLSKKLLSNINIHLVEINNSFIHAQRSNIVHDKIFHHKNIDDALDNIGNDFLFVIANEFFDALPAKQYTYNNNWYEKNVAFDHKKEKLYYIDKLSDYKHYNTTSGNVLSGSVIEKSEPNKIYF